jgi:two-component system phosphate regulon sensor histidine kinase PhoR
VANVSHELKTPLTAIAGFVDTLSRGALHDDENNLRFLNKIEQQVLRLDAMVSDLLSLAQIEADEESFFLEPVEWLPIVNAVIERYRDSGALDECSLTLDSGNDEICAFGQVEAMMQVLDNLLNNAIKYTPRGGTITVRVFARGDKAVLEVEDAGIGIATVDQERIFERFFCADKARSRASGGIGLGLSIVKHLVQKLGGAVEVESELGRGSLFRVVLSLDKDAATNVF